MKKEKISTKAEQVTLSEEISPIVSNVEKQDLKVGEQLRIARVKKKKDIEKIAAILRIRPCYLKALEESKYEEFPGRAYASGFLRNYAAFLGLNVDQLLIQYRQETSFIKPDTMKMPISERQVSFPSVKYLFFALLIIVFIWFFWYFLTYKEMETESVHLIPTEQQTLLNKTADVISENIVVDETAPVSDALPKMKEAEGEIQIVALEEVWVEIEEDDNLILSRTLKKGEVYNVPASKKELFLKTGNAGGMDILVNGQKVKPLGPLGAVRSGVSLSADKLKKR